ncbi:ATP-dependent nuclease [Halobacillus karajensis]|uniref:ATPase n=1 Tax=Halobacillus karajensis TaxID=195088 RepID=A0A059NXW5_9BACI|nr:AAA family ATPase [Halobacillus karajensis]CDQ20890.1 putative ATPase [Halobacillus karajensis]CDQ23640.1 putative ATPase [Halobacillus karajensis]CDQ27118.1 putative ATPase [Halobacillus karajensis]
MRLTKFSVTNYKVFKEKFTIDFSQDSIAILTGRNNTGKSTVLEAINCFYLKETKAKTIPNDCFSMRGKEIKLEAVFESGENKYEIVKKYEEESAPKFYDSENSVITRSHELNEALNEILNNKPFYITPSMLPEDINDLIQNIYSEIIESDLKKLENIGEDEADNAKLKELSREYEDIKRAYPRFVRKLKESTDKLLKEVSYDVSKDLRTLFSNEHINLNVVGGESEGFSSSDILKSTNSSVNIDNSTQSEMPLSNQGTGLQRMSLISLIQNMIHKNLMGESNEKLLLIDEPEAFLHPEAVRALSKSLYSIGQEMPLMISTHSPILIDLSERHTSIQVFRVSDKKAIQLFKSKQDQFDDDDIKNMKILNYVDSYVNEFFFADKILIVEGDTEYIAFRHLAKLHVKNIHIIRARGKSTIRTLMKILNQFNTNYDVIHDVDNKWKYSSQTLKSQKTNCLEILKLRKSDNIRIFSSISNFENAIGLDDVSNEKKTRTIYEIVNQGSDNPELIRAYNEIEKLFKCIVEKDYTITLNQNFLNVSSPEDYDYLFDELIKQKISGEEESKKKEEENVH